MCGREIPPLGLWQASATGLGGGISLSIPHEYPVCNEILFLSHYFTTKTMPTTFYDAVYKFTSARQEDSGWQLFQWKYDTV